MDQIEFANLNKLSGILKSSKQLLDKSKMPVQNRQVQENINKTNKSIPGFQEEEYNDIDDSKEVPDRISEYYNRRSLGQDLSEESDALFGFNEESIKNSKLPKEVLELMRESSKDRSKLESSVSSKLDPELINSVNSKNKKRINESSSQIQSFSNSGVDYEHIKMIMEGCMKKYLSNIKKTLITENNGSTLELMTQQGNTFRFVTSDGKIFEGKLTYKGNINNK